MENKQRSINIMEDNGKVAFDLNGNFTAEDVVLVCNTVILSAMNQITEVYSKTLQAKDLDEDELDKKVTEFKEVLYDFYNVNASVLLNQYAPEIELRPDLSTQAILEAENNIINAKYDDLKQKNQLKDIPEEMMRAQPVEILTEQED